MPHHLCIQLQICYSYSCKWHHQSNQWCNFDLQAGNPMHSLHLDRWMISFSIALIINYVSWSMNHHIKAYEQVGVMAVKSVPLFPMALDSATPARRGFNLFRTITTVCNEVSEQFRKYRKSEQYWFFLGRLSDWYLPIIKFRMNFIPRWISCEKW